MIVSQTSLKKTYSFLLLILCIISCKTERQKKVEALSKIKLVDSTEVVTYSKTITASDLKHHLYIYASDSMQGRNTGSLGQKKAVNYLQNAYKTEDIKSPINDSTYFQTIPSEYFPNHNASENVLAYIKGNENPEEVVVISAHLDHVGVQNDSIYNGADDDGSGTVALLEIAQAFKHAELQGHHPKRSVLLLHVTGEEIGLYGSRYYTENPIFSLDKTIANLNIDMIGRVDDKHKNNSDYIYLIGSDKLSTELHNISERVNNAYTNLDFDYTFNADNDPNRFYYRSDHYNFAKHNIPVIFYFNGAHEDYHKPTDTADKINYPLLEKRTRLIFAMAWQLANQPDWVKVDMAQ